MDNPTIQKLKGKVKQAQGKFDEGIAELRIQHRKSHRDEVEEESIAREQEEEERIAERNEDPEDL